ncbi:MAG: hypothetical protein HQ523_02875 [Lentisphaerae bacterium]|nr:hypothetical protein [Lentisphaerota bacterium]
MSRIILVLMAMVLLVGCGGKGGTESAVVETPAVEHESSFNALFSQARERYNEGDTDAAVDLLVAGLADPQYADEQSSIFRSLLELLLLENRVIDAQTNYLAMLNASPETASQTFAMIPSHLKRQEDPAGYLAWTEQMVTAPLPSNIMENAYSYYVDANVQSKMDDKMDALALTCCTRFGGAGAARIFARPVNALLDRDNYDAVGSILARLSATGDESAAHFVTSSEMTVLAARGEWDAVLTAFVAKAATLPDTGSKLALRSLCDRAMAANQSAVIDQLCEHVIRAMPAATGTRSQAVSSYMAVAVKSKHVADSVARLQKLKTLGVDSQSLGRPLNAVFYDVMGSSDLPLKQSALELVEWVLSELPADGPKAQYQALLMDGSVLINDYRRALTVLESGFRADDAMWHSMAINKVGAHLALQEGRVDDAIAMFRSFMEHVSTWTESTVDPSTGLAHTREMSLGFNAKRIGDILRDAGRAEEAAAAYAEARSYYAEALAALATDSSEYEYVKTEVATIPAPASQPAP